MASRIGWIDTARIIGMLAIIYGHFFPSKGQGFVYSFSVPIFFFLSGYLTKIDSCNFKEAFKKVFYSLFVPMFIFILYNWFFVLKHNHFELRINTTIEPVYRTILGCHQPILGTMWFVYDLIIIRLLSLISSIRTIRLLGIVSLCGMFIVDYLCIGKPLAIINIWGGFVFFWMGVEAKLYDIVEKIIPNQTSISMKTLYLLLALALTIGLYECVQDRIPYWMYIGDCTGNIFMTIILAYIGIAITFLVSKVFDNLPKCFTYLNIGAITVLGVHGTFISIVKSYVDDIILEMPIYPSLFWAISSLVILLLFIPINWLLNKYLPIVLGNRHY